MKKTNNIFTVLIVALLTLIVLITADLFWCSPIKKVGKAPPLSDLPIYRYRAVNYHEDKLFVQGTDCKLLIFDISERTKPELISETCLSSFWMGITIEDGYLFLVRHLEGGILVVDISNIQSPRIVAEYDGAKNGFYNSPLLIDNNIGYIREYIKDEKREQLHILSLQDPLAIKELAIIKNGGEPLGIENKYLYTGFTPEGSYSTHLSILDVSDPGNPVAIKDFPDINRLTDADIQGNHLYLSGYEKFRIVDISDPINPVILGELNLSTDKIIVDNTNVYFLHRWFVGVINVSNPRFPVRMDTDRIGQGLDFVLVDDYIYLVDMFDGLFVYR